MIKFYLSKSVKSDRITLNDFCAGIGFLRFSVGNDEKPDIYTTPLSDLRNSLWYKKDITEIGLFIDPDGVNGIVTFNEQIIDFYYTDENPTQILEDKSGLVSINFTKLNSKLFIDSKTINRYSPIISRLSIIDIEHIADNGIVFNLDNKLYSLIF